jgi:hypothetical protein
MSEIVPKDKQLDKTSKLLNDTTDSLIAGFSSVAASNRKDLILSIGHIFQRLRSGSFLEALKKEWECYIEKGRIKDDYIDSEQHKECLQEMLDFLDKDSPDERRFAILKAIFLGAATEEQSTRDSVLPQQYMSLCRTLSSGEVLVLQTAFAIAESKSWTTKSRAADWLKDIAEKSGLKHSELVEIYEKSLMEKNLLSNRVSSDRSGVYLNPSYRLTQFAIDICKFIKEFDPESALGKKKD